MAKRKWDDPGLDDVWEYWTEAEEGGGRELRKVRVLVVMISDREVGITVLGYDQPQLAPLFLKSTTAEAEAPPMLSLAEPSLQPSTSTTTVKTVSTLSSSGTGSTHLTTTFSTGAGERRSSTTDLTKILAAYETDVGRRLNKKEIEIFMDYIPQVSSCCRLVQLVSV